MTILSFLLPAYFHLRLVSSRRISRNSDSGQGIVHQDNLSYHNNDNVLGYNTSENISNSDRYGSFYYWVLYLFDLFLTVAGGLLCVVSTYLIVSDFVRKYNNGNLSC